MKKAVSAHIETISVHAGHEPDPATAAISPPIHLSTTFERAADGNYPQGFTHIGLINTALTLNGAVQELKKKGAA